MTARRLATSLLALIAAVGLLGVPLGPTSPVDVHAARPDLTITSHATYDVQPDEQRIRVTVDLTMTNHLKDTKTKRYYFDEAFLDVMPRSSGFKLTRKGVSPTVKAIKKADEYTRLRLNYPRLYSGKTAKYRLTFNLNDPGGAPTRDLRVGDSLVSFPVWAFATDSTPGSSVSVVFPPGYEVKVEAGAITDPTTDDEDQTVFDTGKLAKPLDFFAYLVADRPGAYREETVSATVLGEPTELTVRSWPDDEPWAERITGLLTGALPALGDQIGLPWPHDEPLIVEEAVSRSTEGYAGLFDPGRGLVEIAYYADDFVVLHEAAHGWFNGSLLADRWSNEAFASYYAAEVAGSLDVDARGEELTEKLQAAKIPLNAWGPIGQDPGPQEDYAYAAALALARAIGERAGEVGLQAVWSDAAGGVSAYQPPDGAVEHVEDPPDWRGLLDLLEARTDASYVDLWRTWVARPDDLPLLDARATSRQRFDEVTELAADWRLPRPVRDALRAWRFDDADALLADATEALEARADVETAAAASGLIAPAGLRLAFEDDDGFEDAEAEAAAELATIQHYATAEALRPVTSNPILALGLYGESPEADLVAARDALARGDLEESVAASVDAADTWAGAEALGQGRAFSIALLILAAVLFLTMVGMALRRRRRPRHQGVRMARPR